MISTEMIVLTKQPYRETSLLLNGFSPDFGRTSLVAQGAMKLSNKSFPEADLFRELSVEFNEDKPGDLFTVRRMELIASYDAVADVPNHYKMAVRIGGFLLRNAAPGVPMPYTYDTLRSVLIQLSGGTVEAPWDLTQCSVVLKAAFLYENGMLPEVEDPRRNEFLEELVAAGIENSPLPECRPEYWNALNNWLSSLLDCNGFKR
jgi:recombinational DNA repair protein (RecF pathway)